MVHFGGPELWSLIDWAGFDGIEWGALLADDLAWLGCHSSEGPASPGADAMELVSFWGKFAQASCSAWKAKVRRTTQRAVIWEEAQAAASTATSHTQAADPNRAAASTEGPARERWQCPDCPRECPTRHALAAHRVVKHGWRTRSRYYARDS